VWKSAETLNEIAIIFDRLAFFVAEVQVRGSGKNLCLKLLPEAGHHRENYDQRGHPQRHRSDCDYGDDRNHHLFALRSQVSNSDE